MIYLYIALSIIILIGLISSYVNVKDLKRALIKEGKLNAVDLKMYYLIFFVMGTILFPFSFYNLLFRRNRSFGDVMIKNINDDE